MCVCTNRVYKYVYIGFPGGAGGKEPPPANAGDNAGFNPWVKKTPGGGCGNPLQCSRLKNPMDRGAWDYSP